MSLAEVLIVSEHRAEAVPVVEDALRRYDSKEVVPAAARARALIEELAPSVAAAVSVATPRLQ
jgi:hypothetical protein